MIKIKFTCNFTDSDSLTSRIVNNYVTDENYDSNIIFTTSNDYDYLFVVNKLLEKPFVSKERIFTFIMEPSWSLNWDRNCFSYSNKVFTHDRNLYGGHDNIIECPSYMFYHMNNQRNSIKKLLDNNNFDKKKNISMIVSYTPNYNNYNYKVRTDLALQILKYNIDVDIYGKDWPLLNNHVKGPIFDKYDALIDYKYSIGIENTCEKNYVTEKFFDISLCNAMPIYYGAPNIDNVYDNYVSINPLNVSESLDLISDILKKDSYEQDKIIENKLKYFKDFNLYNMVKKLVQ